MRMPIRVKTSSMEIYDKLPLIKYHSEIIFSSNVPLNAISKIIGNFKKNGINLELHKFDNRCVLIRKSPIDSRQIDVIYKKF